MIDIIIKEISQREERDSLGDVQIFTVNVSLLFPPAAWCKIIFREKETQDL